MPPKAAPRPAQPAQRYFRGKAPRGAAAVSESDSDSEQDNDEQNEADVPIGGDVSADDEDDQARDDIPKFDAASRGMNVSLKNVNISVTGKVIVDGREESGRTLMEQGEFMFRT